MATAGLSFESPLFKASSGVPSVVVNPYEPFNPTAATGLDGLGGGGMADIATLGRAAVQALSPSRFTLPEMKAPSIGYSSSKKQFFVQGTVFGEDDAQRALDAEQLLGGAPTGLPTTGDWIPLTPQQYRQYTQSIREPGLGTLASKSFGRGVDVAQMLAGRGLQLAGAEQLGGRIVERQMEDLRKTSPYERQFTDIESGGDAVEWLVANAAQQGPNIIESIVTGALGFLAGTASSGNPLGGAAASVASLIGKESWKNSVKEVLKKRAAGQTLTAAEQKTLRNAAGIGMATAATFGNSMATGAADIYGELRERGADADDVGARLTAIAGSLPYAALDVMPEALLFSRLLGAGRPALSTLGTTRAKAGEVLRRGAMGGAVGGLAEGTAELGQESLLLGLSDQDFADPQNINRLINSFAAGAGVGGPIGAGVNIVNPSNLLQPGGSTQPVTGEQKITPPTLPANAPSGTQGELFPIAPGELAGPAVSMLPEQPAAPPMPQPGQMALFAPTAEDRLTRGIIPPGPGMQGELALVGGQVAPGYVPPVVFPTEQPAAPTGLTPLEAAAQGALQFAPAAPAPQGPTAVGLALQQAQQRQQMEQMRQQREAQLAAQREADLARLSNVAAAQRQLDLIPPPPPFGVPMVPVTQAQPQQLPLFSRREAPIPPRAGQLRRGGRMQMPAEEVTAAPVSTVLTAEVLDATGLPKNSKFYRALLGKDMADPAQQPEIGATFGEIRASKSVKQSTRDAVEQLAMRAFGALATQAELGLAPPAPAPTPRGRKPRAVQKPSAAPVSPPPPPEAGAGVGAQVPAVKQAAPKGEKLKAKPAVKEAKKPLKKAPPPAAAEELLDIRYERGGPVGSFLQGAEKIGSGSESDVFRKGNIVIKVAEPYSDKSEDTFNKRITDAIAVDRVLGDGTLKYVGYYLSPNGTKNPVFQQPLVEGRPATRQEIRSYMEGKGFSVSQTGATTDTFTKTVDGQLLTARDLDGDNVRIDGTGRTRVIDGQLDFAPAPKKPLKKAPPPAAAPPAPGLDTRVSPDVATQRERNLRAKARDKERPGDVMLGNGMFVSMRDALEAARAAVADGVLNPEAPFQYSAVLDIAPRDWDRMVEAMRKPEKAPPPKPEGAVAAAPAPAPTPAPTPAPAPTKTAEEIEAEAAAARAALAAEAVDAETQWNDNRDTSDVMFADLPAAAKARWQASDRSGAAQITIVEELNDDLISMTNAERLNYALAAATAAVEANNNAQFDAVIDTIVDVAYFKPDGYSVEQQGEALDFLADPDNFTNAQNATIQDSFVTTAEGRTLEARTKPKKGEAGVGGGALKPWYTYASSVPGMIQRLAKASVVFRSLDRADAEQLLKDGMITRANLPDSVANAILGKEVTARAQDDATPQATPLAKLEALIAQTNRSTSPLNKQAQDNRNAELARLYKEATDQDFDTASVDQFFENGAPRTANVDGMFRVLNEEDYTNRDALEKANREERAAKDAARRAPRLSTFDDWEEDGRFFTDDGKPIAAPLSVGRVRIGVASFLSKLFVKPQVSIFRNQADLKARNPQLYARAAAARAAGDFDITPAKGYSFGGNQVIIFTDRIRTEQELRFVLAHESLGHFGLRSIMPAKDFDRLMEEIYDLSPNVQMAVDAAMDARGLPKAEAVEEYLADFAASLDVSYIAKIWNAIKGFMNKLGVKFGDEAARYWVDQARRYVRNGQVSSAFTVQDVFTRMQAIESGQDPDNSGRFLRTGDLRMDNLRAADLMKDVIGTAPTDIAEAFRTIRGIAGNTAETADKFLAQVFSLMNFRARENAGAYAVERTLQGGREIAMSQRNALNEKLAPLLSRAVEVPWSKISLGGGITTAQYDEVNRALYGAQRLRASTAPTPKELGRVPLYTVDPTTGELTPNQPEIDRLYNMGLISPEQMRDGFTFKDTYLTPEGVKTETVKVPGIPGLTEDSIQWKAYIAAREAMRDVELRLLRARYESHTQERKLMLREIGSTTRTGKLTKEEKDFFEKVFAQYKALWTADPITDDKGRLATNPDSVTRANDFLAKFNTALIATQKAATDTVAQERNDALRQFLEQPVADDLIASIEKFKDRFVLSDETRFLVQNRMGGLITAEVSNDGADVATRRNLAIGFVPVLRRGVFQLRVQATVNGKAVRLKQEYKDQLIYSQFESLAEATEYSKRINDLFQEDGKPKTYKVEAFNEDTLKYELMDVQLKAIPGTALDGVAAPPELNLDDFARGLRQFSIALPPRKLEQVIKALTDQNDRARQRLERNFVPGASPDAGRAVAEHIEARASTIAKIMMRPRLAELTNLNLGSTRALWMGDEDRLKMLEERWKQGVPGAKQDYDLYAFQYNKTNPIVNGVRVERGFQYFNETARALKFLEEGENIDVTGADLGKVSSALRAATSAAQLGASVATGSLNYVGAINSVIYLATYNDSTGFGGGFGLARSNAAFFRALRQVGLVKATVARLTTRGDAAENLNTAEFYDRVAASDALQKKYKLTKDEAEFIAKEIKAGVMIPALFNSVANTARGRITNGAFQKFVDGWMWTFNATEQAVRRAVGLAAYRLARDRVLGNSEDRTNPETLASAYAMGREMAVNTLNFTMGDYAVMNRPPMWRSGVLSFVYMYKAYPTTVIQMFRNLPREGKAYVLMSLFMLGGISAFPFAEDIEDLMDTIAQLLGFTKASVRFEIAKLVDSAVPGLSPYVLRGFANAFFAGNVADRVSTGNFIPGTGLFLAGANVGRELTDIAGPAMSFLTGVASSAANIVRAAATERVTMVDVLRESPVTMARALGDSVAYTQAGGVVDRRGYIVTPDDSAAIIATRLLGFYPAAAAEQFQVIRVAKRMTDYQKEVVAGFRVAWVKAKIQGDEGQAQDVVDAVADWNESARGTGLEIRNFLTNANRALREAQRPAGERFLRAAPRAAREDIETMADLLGY